MLLSHRFITRAPFLLGMVLFLLFFSGKIFWGLSIYQGDEKLNSIQFSHVYLDAEGKILQALPVKDGLRRIYYPFQKIPESLKKLVVELEDKRFYLHAGFDLVALVRALTQNTGSGREISGASTIPMQLARLVIPRPRTIENKIYEAMEAMQLSARLSKDELLSYYINLIPFGNNIEGYPAAAYAFFGKPLEDLTLEQMEILSVIPRSPEKYAPHNNPEQNKAILHLLGLETESLEFRLAYESVQNPQRTQAWPFRAPQYIRYLENQEDSKNNRGLEPKITYISPKIQNYAETLLAMTVAEARKKRISNAAILLLEPNTLHVLAWVGSVDFYSDNDKGQLDGVTIARQPGSTLKPFLYSLALERGFTASSILPDIDLDFGGKAVYTPANFNDQFNGPVRLRQALSSSLNIPAVYMLERLGVSSFTQRLIDLGMHSLEAQRSNLGLGLALGNAEISLKELVEAYGVIYNEGLDISENPPRRIIDRAASLLIRDILTKHPDRTLAFGHTSDNKLPFERALKTGTSNQFNNIWAVGFTKDLLGGVWMGNFDGQTIVGTADSGYPASIMNRVLEAFTKNQYFEELTQFTKVKICSLSGMEATDDCPHSMVEYFIHGTEPEKCTWHKTEHGSLQTYLPQEFEYWSKKYRYSSKKFDSNSSLRFIRPLDKSQFFIDPNLPMEQQAIRIEATGTESGQLRIDGKIAMEGNFPLQYFYPIRPGLHVITVTDESGEQSIEISVK